MREGGAGGEEIVGPEDGLRRVDRGLEMPFEDLSFFAFDGIVDEDFEHEAVELGFGQGVGAFLFDGVLGGEDHERLGEVEGFAADADVAFLHGFEQGGLDFGGGAIDFVGEDDVGEDGAAADFELGGLGVVDLGAGEVGGQEVGRELEADEVGVDGTGDGRDAQRFGEAGDAFEEAVSVAEKGDEEAGDEGVLADDDAGDGIADGLELPGRSCDRGRAICCVVRC